MRRTLEAHLCPLWYFSSQVKHRSHSRREEISSSERRRTGAGGGRAGEGNRGGSIVKRGGIDDNGGGEGRAVILVAESFSSCRLARLAACTSVRGWWACTSRRISGARPETKHTRRNGGGKPMMRLASVSNSDR